MKFGIIGCGHMAGIILDKMINNGIVNAVDVKVSVKHENIYLKDLNGELLQKVNL